MARLKNDLDTRTDGRNAIADRAIEILLSFSDDKPVLSAEQLREANGMSRSAIYRYLTSLRANGFIAEEPGQGFRLGPKLIEMARIARRDNPIMDVAQHHIRQLAAECGEIVQLLERVGRQLILLEKIDSQHTIGITHLRGGMLPSPAGSSAKVLIAFAPPKEFDELLRSVDLQAYTAKSITDANELRQQIDLVRQNGYALNDEELDEGVRAVAAPVFGRHEVRYAVSVVGPSFRLTDEALPELISKVKATAASISSELQQRES